MLERHEVLDVLPWQPVDAGAGGEMVEELLGCRDEAAAGDQALAHARPFRAPILVPSLLVVCDLGVAAVLAGDEDVVHDALHAEAALRGEALDRRELVAAGDKIGKCRNLRIEMR